MPTISQEPHLLDIVIRGAHDICDRLFLFEAVSMSETELRAFLSSNDVPERSRQDRYIEYVKMYRNAHA